MKKIKVSKCCKQPVIEANRIRGVNTFCSGANGCGEWCEVVEVEIPIQKKKIIIDIDGWVSLEDGEQEIGLGDLGVDVVIENRRDEHEERKLLEGFAHVLNCPICKKKATDRACDDTSKEIKQ